MGAANWIAIGVAIATLISNWCQFWVRESLFTKSSPSGDRIINAFKSRGGVLFIVFTRVLSAISIILLIIIVTSPEPLTRVVSFQISSLTVLAILNFVLVHSLFTLRRMAILQEEIKAAEIRSKRYTNFIS